MQPFITKRLVLSKITLSGANSLPWPPKVIILQDYVRYRTERLVAKLYRYARGQNLQLKFRQDGLLMISWMIFYHPDYSTILIKGAIS
jgi:hypothetical protein